MAQTKTLIVRDFQPNDLWTVALNMRDEDRAEIKASHGADPLTALIASVEGSDLKWTITDEQLGVIGIFGVGRSVGEPRRGSPWLLATPDLELRYISFLRQARGYVQQMQDAYPFLENWVDARNTVSIKWLAWCGFTLDEPETFGVEGRLFRRFDMRREDDVYASDSSGEFSRGCDAVHVGNPVG